MILALHRSIQITPPAQSFERSSLTGDRSAENSILVNFHHGLDQRSRRTGIAQPKTGHGKCLRKPMEQNRPLTHSRKGRDADMLFLVVAQLTVNLIAQNNEIVLHAQLRDSLEILL